MSLILISLSTILILLVYYFTIRYNIFSGSISYRYPRILMYHMVSPHKKNAQFNGLRVSPQVFEAQLDYLHKNGWKSFTMAEIIEHQISLPEKSFVLTFDDGYLDNYTTVLPLLQKYNFKATLYLVLNRHHNEWSIHRKQNHRTGELKNEPKLEDFHIKKMLESGCFEIGAHTLNHPNFIKLTSEETQHEIKESKRKIEALFSTKCVSFSYPFGLYKQEDWKIVQEAGFTSATTTQKGISKLESCNLFLLNRITISGKDNLLAFRLKLRRGMRGLKK